MSFKQVENVRDQTNKPKLFDPYSQMWRKPFDDMMKCKYYEYAFEHYNHWLKTNRPKYMSKLNDLIDEDSEVLSKFGTTYVEAVLRLVENHCIQEKQMLMHQTRIREAELKEEEHLRKTYRTLYNDGTKFSPIL